MNGESGVTQSINDELQSWEIEVDKTEGKSGVLEVSLMNFILRTSKEIKWKVKVELLEVSLMNIILWISKENKRKVRVMLLELSLINFILWICNEIKWKV